MKKLTDETEKIMVERFGKDTIIALATVENGIPYVVRSKFNNGIKYLVKKTHNIEVSPSGVISFGAENANFFYQD